MTVGGAGVWPATARQATRPQARGPRAPEWRDGARPRNSSRRRRIREELEAKRSVKKDTWALQQQLLQAGVGETLMNAARQWFQPADYDAVVEERSLDGLCGYPPCSNPARGAASNKKWLLNLRDHEVLPAAEQAMFCCSECLQQSAAWSMTLQPDPAYVRPASALAASRAAVAEATVRSKAPQRVDPGGGGVAEPIPASSDGGADQQRPMPKVRQKAVVRFSRDTHEYWVQYGDYDGGGALPGVPPSSQEPVAAAPCPGKVTQGSLKQLLSAPVLERDSAECAPARGGIAEESIEAAALAEDSCLDKEPGDSDCAEDGDVGDDGFFEAEAVFPSAKWSGSPAVRAWGVLSSWLTGLAKEVLCTGVRVPTLDEETDSAHVSRRELLLELLMARVPGDCSFLTRRFHQVIFALGVHQALPSMSEVYLWDLLAVFLLRATLRCDVRRGVLDPNPFCERVLERQIRLAAEGLGISTDELSVLDTTLPDEAR